MRATMFASATTARSAHGSAEGRAAFGQSLAAVTPSLSPPGPALDRICVAMYSAPFWQMLRDRGSCRPWKRARRNDALETVISAAKDRATRANTSLNQSPGDPAMSMKRLETTEPAGLGASPTPVRSSIVAAGDGRTPAPLNIVGEETLVNGVGRGPPTEHWAFFHLVAPPMSGAAPTCHCARGELF